MAEKLALLSLSFASGSQVHLALFEDSALTLYDELSVLLP